jgi:hypothetical protein
VSCSKKSFKNLNQEYVWRTAHWLNMAENNAIDFGREIYLPDVLQIETKNFNKNFLNVKLGPA